MPWRKNNSQEEACFAFCICHRTCSVKKGVLRNFTKFTGKHLCQRLFFNKVVGLRLATLLKKSLWHRCFSVNFAKFLRTPLLQNTSGRLLLSWLQTGFRYCLNLKKIWMFHSFQEWLFSVSSKNGTHYGYNNFIYYSLYFNLPLQ